MYFMGQNKKKEETKKKERAEKAKLKDVNMAAPSFDRQILNEQHAREKAAKEKERATPGENAVSESPLTLFSKLFTIICCTYIHTSLRQTFLLLVHEFSSHVLTLCCICSTTTLLYFVFT